MKSHNNLLVLLFLISCGNISQEANSNESSLSNPPLVQTILNNFGVTNYYDMDNPNTFFLIKESERFYSSWFLALQPLDSLTYRVIFHKRPSVGYTGLEDQSDDEMKFLYTQSYSMIISSAVRDSLFNLTNPILGAGKKEGSLTSPIYVMYYKGQIYSSNTENRKQFEVIDGFIKDNIIKTIDYKMKHPKVKIDSADFTKFRKSSGE